MKNFITNLRKQTVVGVLNICCLSLGIMVAVIVGLWTFQELSFDRFHKNKERIYRIITSYNTNGEWAKIPSTFQPFGKDAKEKLPLVEDACRVYMRNFDLNINNDWHSGTHTVIADQNFFSFFTFPLKEGNPKDVLSAPNQVVISESAAARYFLQQNPIGRTVKYFDNNFTVSGIMTDIPVNSSLQADFVFPLFGMFADARWGTENSCNAFLLLREGTIADDLSMPLKQVFFQGFGVDEKDVENVEEGKMISISLEPLNKIHFDTDLVNDFVNNKGSKSFVMIFALTALIILIISCINFANLFVSTSFTRAKMVGVKKCMGAGENLLVREFYIETACYVFVSAILGLLLASSVLPLFNNFTQSGLTIDFTSPRLYIFLAALFTVTVLLAGSFPALYITRFGVVETLSGKFKGKQASAFQKSLTVFQFAASLALLIIVFFMQKQVDYLVSYDLGFDKEHIVYLNGRPGFNKNFEAFKDELLKEPAIVDVARKSDFLTARNRVIEIRKIPFEDQYPFSIDVSFVSPNFFDVLGMKFIDGENPFIYKSVTDSEVVLNEAAVKMLGYEQTVGREAFFSGKNVTIKGVIKDAHTKSLHQDVFPEIYTKLDDSQAGYSTVFFKIAGNPQRALGFIEQKWKEREGNYPFEYHFLDDTYKQLYKSEINAQKVFSFAMLITLVITIAGLFAMAYYAVQRREREIALRKVNGASIKALFVMLNKGFLLWVAIAFAVACPVAYYGVHKWLDGFAVKTSLSLWVFLLVGAMALLITLLATGYQTWKAATENPVKALKTE